jgi:hypothetical protein
MDGSPFAHARANVLPRRREGGGSRPEAGRFRRGSIAVLVLKNRELTDAERQTYLRE